MDAQTLSPRAVRNSLDALDVGVSASKLTNILFAKALEFRGEDSMRALEAVRIAAAEDEEQFAKGRDGSKNLRILASSWGVDVGSSIGFASEDRQREAEHVQMLLRAGRTEDATRALIRYVPLIGEMEPQHQEHLVQVLCDAGCDEPDDSYGRHK